jgi:hypothetical protein
MQLLPNSSTLESDPPPPSNKLRVEADRDLVGGDAEGRTDNFRITNVVAHMAQGCTGLAVTCTGVELDTRR